MSEVVRDRTELQPHEAIAQVFHDWLVAEVESSSQNQNAILDDWASFHAALQMPFSDNANVSARKADSHYSRLRLWTDEFAKGHVDDSSIAHQIYGTLTGMSGAFRTQCNTFASNQNQYTTRRQNGEPLGINISVQVQKRLVERFGKLPDQQDLAYKANSLGELVELTHTTNESRLEIIKQLYDGKPLLGLRKVVALMRLMRNQREWLDLGVDYVIYAAQKNDGDLTKVPFMQPLPITHAEVEYPFTEQ